MMKRLIAMLMVLLTLLALTSCGGAPLVATATPEPTVTPEPTATPEPTKEAPKATMLPVDSWPQTELTKMLPEFPSKLETAMQRGDELFFCAFTEFDASAMTDYYDALKAAGFTVVIEDNGYVYSASHEELGEDDVVQLFFEGSAGTLQLTDKRAEK